MAKQAQGYKEWLDEHKEELRTITETEKREVDIASILRDMLKGRLREPAYYKKPCKP